MAVSTLLLALGVSLATTTTVEVGIAANHRDAVQTLHAADAALEHAIAELGTVPLWDAVLDGVVTSWFRDGAGVVVLPDGSRLDVAAETGLLRCGAPGPCGDADMDQQTAERPWGRNNPRWTVYASGRLARLLREAAPSSRGLRRGVGRRRPVRERRAAAARRRPPGPGQRRQPGQPGPWGAVAPRAGVRPVGSQAHARGRGRTRRAPAAGYAAHSSLA